MSWEKVMDTTGDGDGDRKQQNRRVSGKPCDRDQYRDGR